MGIINQTNIIENHFEQIAKAKEELLNEGLDPKYVRIPHKHFDIYGERTVTQLGLEIIAHYSTSNLIYVTDRRWKKQIYIPMHVKQVASDDICYHDYKSYVGLTDKYQYCTRCDVKKYD